MIFVTNKIRAFTFIELFIIIVIIGILAGVSAPRFKKAFDNFELEKFVKDIYYLSRYLQGSAIAEGRIYRLNIDKEKGELRAAFKEDGEFKDVKGRFGKIYKAPAGVTISLEPAEKTEIYFYPDGSVEKAAITLRNQHKSELSLIIKGASGEIQIK